jgi:hypothetical protein
MTTRLVDEQTLAHRTRGLRTKASGPCLETTDQYGDFGRRGIGYQLGSCERATLWGYSRGAWLACMAAIEFPPQYSLERART